MTRTPIAVVDIRRGDSIRFESADPATSLIAREYRASADSSGINEAGTYFLLNRPAPAVELPVQPTLGWLTWRDAIAISDATELGLWRTFHSPSTIACGDTSVPQNMVTAFTAATAVPTGAVDALRHYMSAFRFLDGSNPTPAQRRIRDFLAAVDSANGSPS